MPSSSRTKTALKSSAGAARARDNERPLVEDIRLLGRILGDVIREQEGQAAYELIEQVRKLSVAFRRDADQEAERDDRLTIEKLKLAGMDSPYFKSARLDRFNKNTPARARVAYFVTCTPRPARMILAAGLPSISPPIRTPIW